MVRQGHIQFATNNLIFIDFLALLTMKCKHYLSRLLSLFTSPVIKRNDIVYPDFVGENAQIGNIGDFSRPIPACTAFAFRADWQDVNIGLEIAYVKMNDATERAVSLIGMYSEHPSKYPYPIKIIFDGTFWKELPVMTHETFRFYLENLGMYVTMLAIPDLADKYNTKIGLSTANFEEWCSIMASQSPFIKEERDPQ